MGSDYIPHALQWAHDADPDARLFINENWADGLSEQSDALYGLVEDLLRQGVPLHGVGFQMAVGFGDGEEIEHPIPQDELAQNYRRFSELGLEIHVTEMTVRIGAGRGPIEQRLAEQADVYRDVLSVGLETPGFKALVIWGVSDADPWSSEYGRQDKPFLFDEEYRPKPAYKSLQRVLLKKAASV